MNDPSMPAVASPPTLGFQEALLLDTGDPPSELDKIIEMILNAANIGHLTDLTPNEIAAFSKARALCKRHPKVMKAGLDLIAENLVLRVSKSRKGRAEMIKILNRSLGVSEQMMAEQTRRPFWGRRRGG